VLRQQTGEISHLLLQRGDLGLQGSNLLRQDEERSGKLWRRDRFGGRLFLWKGSQAPLMEVGKHVQVLIAHPFFVTIVGKESQEIGRQRCFAGHKWCVLFCKASASARIYPCSVRWMSGE
jgi:hypothetical protein